MVNISPIGRNASVQERHDYEKYDAQHQIRSKFVAALKEKFPEFGLTYVVSDLLPPFFLLFSFNFSTLFFNEICSLLLLFIFISIFSNLLSHSRSPSLFPSP